MNACIASREILRVIAAFSLFVASHASANDANLLLRYSFNKTGDATVIDDTGVGFDATLHGDAVFDFNNAWAGGAAKYGNAIKLDGNGDYVSLDSAFHNSLNRLDPETIAITAWIRPAAAGSGDQYIVSKIDHSAETGYALSIDAATSLLHGEVYLDGMAGVTELIGTTAVASSTWTHVVFIFDGQALKLFVNGSLDAAAANMGATDSVTPSSAKLTVGALAGAISANEFNGHIDELNLYSVLSDADMEALVNSAGGEPGLLLYESFDSIAEMLFNPHSEWAWAGTAGSQVAGVFGNALYFQGAGQVSGRLSIPAAGNIDPSKGHISLWYRPDYAAADGVEHTLLETNDRGLSGIQIMRTSSSPARTLRLRLGDQNLISEPHEFAVVETWAQNEWHHIEFIWDLTPSTDKYMAYIVDGEHAYLRTGADLVTPWESPTTLYIGSSENGAYMSGAIDELKIYAQPKYNPLVDHAAKIREYRTANARDGIKQAFETVYTAADGQLPDAALAAKDPVTFYQTAPFERVYAGTVPDAADLSDTLGYRVARDDTESLFFNIYSQVDATDVTIALGDLRNGSGIAVIPATNIKLRVVKNWWQRDVGSGDRPDFFPAWVPELLMADDRVNFKYDDYDAGSVVSYAPDANSEQMPNTNLPAFPLATAQISTELNKYTSKQFMVELSIPAALSAGNYTLTATATGNGITGSRTLTMNVEVLPLNLPIADKDFLIYHRAQYLSGPANEWDAFDVVADRNYYLSELRDIRAHGMNGVTVFGTSQAYVDDLVEAGFHASSKVVYRSEYASEALAAKIKSKFTAAWFAGEDEPDTLERLNLQMQQAAAVHAEEMQAKLISAVYLEIADCLTTPHRQRLADTYNSQSLVNFCPFPGVDVGSDQHTDYENISVYDLQSYQTAYGPVQPTQAYFAGLLDGSVIKDPQTQGFYWQLRVEDARVNRYYAGVHLFLTGLAGIFPYVYMHNRGGDPYNDFDQPIDYHANVLDHREMGAVYPTQAGPMTTIEWEALREGIDDYRYLQLWQSRYKAVVAFNASLANASKAIVDATLLQFRYQLDNTLASVSNADFDASRQIVANEIIKLQSSDLAVSGQLAATRGSSKFINRVTIGETVINNGPAATIGQFTVSYYLSINTTFDVTDLPLAAVDKGSAPCQRTVGAALNVGEVSSIAAKQCWKPSGTVAGRRYYVLVVVDSANTQSEINEGNNAGATTNTVRW